MERSLKNQIYVSNINQHITEKDLVDHFGSYGEVIRCHLSKYPNKKNKGFAKLAFADKSTLERILQERHVIKERELKVKVFESNRWTYNKRKVNLGEIPDIFDKEKLTRTFSKYGEIEDVGLERNGSGYVLFKEVESARKVTLYRFFKVGNYDLKILTKKEIDDKYNLHRKKNKAEEIIEGSEDKSIIPRYPSNFYGAFSYDIPEHCQMYPIPHYSSPERNLIKRFWRKNAPGMIYPSNVKNTYNLKNFRTIYGSKKSFSLRTIEKSDLEFMNEISFLNSLNDNEKNKTIIWIITSRIMKKIMENHNRDNIRFN